MTKYLFRWTQCPDHGVSGKRLLRAFSVKYYGEKMEIKTSFDISRHDPYIRHPEVLLFLRSFAERHCFVAHKRCVSMRFCSNKQPYSVGLKTDAMSMRKQIQSLLPQFSLLVMTACVFTSMVVPQCVGITLEVYETQAPAQEDTNSSEEEERLANVSIRWKTRAIPNFAHRGPCRNELFRRPQASCLSQAPTIVGHYLANGLRAPLMI